MSQSPNYKNKVNSKILDYSKKIESKPVNKKVMVQDWLNKNQNENELDGNSYIHKMIETWKLKNLQDNIINNKFPSIGTLNSLTLEQTVAYEAMLINIMDKKPSSLNTSVEILLHLKIISNNQMYKFRIFE